MANFTTHLVSVSGAPQEPVPLSEIPVELWILKILANSSHQTGSQAIPRHPDLQTAHLLRALWLGSLNRTSSKPDGQVWIQDPHLERRFVIGANPTLRSTGFPETPGVSRPCIWSTMHLSGLGIAYPECPFGPLWSAWFPSNNSATSWISNWMTSLSRVQWKWIQMSFS